MNLRHEVINLNAEESKSFVDDFLNPPPPNEALKKAALRYKEIMEGRSDRQNNSQK